MSIRRTATATLPPNIEERIVSTVSPICSEIAPQIYEGSEKTFCTYNYYELPQLMAESEARRRVYVCQVHYCCPKGTDSRAARVSLRNAIESVFTACSISDASDRSGQHWVFEFRGKNNGSV